MPYPFSESASTLLIASRASISSKRDYAEPFTVTDSPGILASKKSKPNSNRSSIGPESIASRIQRCGENKHGNIADSTQCGSTLLQSAEFDRSDRFHRQIVYNRYSLHPSDQGSGDSLPKDNSQFVIPHTRRTASEPRAGSQFYESSALIGPYVKICKIILLAESELLFREVGSTFQTGTREIPHEIVCDMLLR